MHVQKTYNDVYLKIITRTIAYILKVIDASLIIEKCLMTHIRCPNCSTMTHKGESNIADQSYLCNFYLHVLFVKKIQRSLGPFMDLRDSPKRISSLETNK